MSEDATSNLLRQIVLLETALSLVGTAICVCDRDWRLEFANRRFADIWTLDAASLVAGTPLTTLLAPVSRREDGSPNVVDEYLRWCRTLDADGGERARDVKLENGRMYAVRHHPLANEAWLITLDDVTAEAIHAGLASERLSLQSLIDTVPDYLWVKDVDCRFIIANKALAMDWGKRPADIVGLSDHDFHPPERAADFARSERAIIEADQPIFDRHEFVRDSHGAGKWFSSTKMPLRDLSGSIVGIVGISRDITELRREVSFREGQATVLEMIATATPLRDILRTIAGLIEAQICDAAASILLCNPERTWIGGDEDRSVRESLDRILDRLLAAGETPFESGLAISGGGDDRHRDGCQLTAGPPDDHPTWSLGIVSQDKMLGVLALHPSTSRVPNPHETAVVEMASRLAGIAVERQMTEERIRYMADNDALTGLSNRSRLDDLLAKAIDAADHQGGGFQVLFLDLDNFKSINDSLGHHVGDALLKEVAMRLKRCVRSCDSVIRLGGDEFVVILAGQSTTAIQDTVAVERIVASVASPFLFGDHQLDVSCSVGVASFPNDGKTPESLLTKADLAMYRSKQNGKGRFTVYDDRARSYAS